MSRYRYLSRTSSLTSAEPSTGNGSGSASLSTSTSSATTSISPVGSSGFSFPAGPARTAPGTPPQNPAPHPRQAAPGHPEVNEHNPAVVPAPRHPASQHHVLPGVRNAQRARLVGA